MYTIVMNGEVVATTNRKFLALGKATRLSYTGAIVTVWRGAEIVWAV